MRIDCAPRIGRVVGELGAVAIPGHGRPGRHTDSTPTPVNIVGSGVVGELGAITIPGHGRVIISVNCTAINTGVVGEELGTVANPEHSRRSLRVDSTSTTTTSGVGDEFGAIAIPGNGPKIPCRDGTCCMIAGVGDETWCSRHPRTRSI